MPISSSDLAELAKSTLDDYVRNLPVDQIGEEKPFLKKMMEGKKKFGGAKQYIVETLRKSYGSNFAWTYGDAQVSFNKRDSLAQTNFPWRRCVDGLYIDYDKLFSNGIRVVEGDRGSFKLETNEKIQLVNLLNEQMTILKEGFLEKLDIEIHRDGTSGTDAIGGLDLLVSTTPTTGTVGGINRATDTYWRNYAKTGITAANIPAEMEAAWRSCVRYGGKAPDFIMAGSDFIDAFRTCVTLTQNVDAGSSKKLEVGFGEGTGTGLYFKGKEIVWNPTFDKLDTLDSPTTAWSKRCYMLNTSNLKWREDGMQVVTPNRPHDYLILYEMVTLRCAMTMDKANSHAVLAIS